MRPHHYLAQPSTANFPFSASDNKRALRFKSAKTLITTYAFVLCLLVGTAVAGSFVSPLLVRLAYVCGAFAIGLAAYRAGGLPLNVEVVIALFAFTPFVRRLVDIHAGYDESSLMIAAPLFAMVATFSQLHLLVSTRASQTQKLLLPCGIAMACIGYGWALSAFEGAIVGSSILAFKYAAPILYGICLTLQPNQGDKILEAAARCFLIISPIIGLYGIEQYLNPPVWDAYWMVMNKSPSIGKPLPFQVRVFSTMNAPVSFADYATFGFLLFSFSERINKGVAIISTIAVLPLGIAILLSGVRTAWIATAVSLCVCIVMRQTRSRALILLVCAGLVTVGAMSSTSVGQTITDRLSTMSNSVSSDGSGAERLSDYTHVFLDDDRYILGLGLAPVDPDVQMMALDGQLLASASQMGRTIGVIFVLCIIWAAVQALMSVSSKMHPLRVVCAALLIANLVILPLTAVSSGELGFLLWLIIGVLASEPPRVSDARMAPD